MNVGKHYQGVRGRRYFAWQENVASAGMGLNRADFQPYIHAEDAVVDYGCGGGDLLAALRAGHKIGIEVNPEARAKAARRGLHIVANAQAVPSASADVIISNHVLEHTLDPYGELTSMHRILKERGRLVLRLPVDDWRVQRGPSNDRNHHLYTWTPLLLRNLLTEACFDVHECRVVTRAWPPAHQLLSQILPRRAFDALAFLTAALLRRRELFAIATPAGAQAETEHATRTAAEAPE